MKILVRMPNWVGDVVMATPTLRALRQAHPHAEITAALRAPLSPILRDHPTAPSILALDPGSLATRARQIRAGRYDAALILTSSFGTALEAFLARVPRRIGYRADGRRLLLTDSLARRRDVSGKRVPEPMVGFYLELAALLGAAAAADRRYELAHSACDEAAAAAWLERAGVGDEDLVFGLNPGASFGSSKLWRVDRFAEVGDRLAGQWGARPLLLGGPGEEGLLADIASRMRSTAAGAGEILPLGPLKALMARLALLVTTDSGPRAIAQAYGVPTVVLMGPMHPGWSDSNNEDAAVLRHDVPCGPCHLKVCPTDHACMERITADEVVAAALPALSRPPTKKV